MHANTRSTFGDLEEDFNRKDIVKKNDIPAIGKHKLRQLLGFF